MRSNTATHARNQTLNERNQAVSFRTNRHKYASFRTYANAEAYFNNTPAIRGQDKEVMGVPLRKDRKHRDTHFLRKEGDAYIVRMYHDDIAVFWSDGEVAINTSYNSLSTDALATNFTPSGHYPVRRNGQPLMYAGSGRYYLAKKPIVFKDGQIINKDSLRVSKKVLNRKRAKTVRDLYAPLLNYIHTIRSLSDDGLAPQAVGPWEGAVGGGLDHTNPDNFPRILREFWMTIWTPVHSGYRAFIRPEAEKVIINRAYERHGAYDWMPLEEGEIHKTMRYTNQD